ncbi:MAG: tetratricopeptide repeat protein [Bacteroidota bacterium]
MNEIQLTNMLDQARYLVEQGKVLHAVQVYHRILATEPQYLEASLELSSLYLESGNAGCAEEILQRAFEQSGKKSKIIFMLGNLQLRRGNFDKAITYYKMLDEKKIPEVHFNMGFAYFYKNNIKLAEHHLRLTMKYNPRFPKINESLGELLIKRRAYAEAITYLKRGLQSDPYSCINHYLLGVPHAHLFDWQNAYDSFVTAIEMDRNEVSAWQMCGRALLRLRRLDEAEQYLRKAYDLNPHLPDTLVDFGQLHLQRGETDTATRFFEKALEFEPGNPEATDGKVKVKILSKKYSC